MTIYDYLGRIFAFFGVAPSAAAPSAKAFLDSVGYTAMSLGSLFLLLAIQQGDTTPSKFLAFLGASWWPFLFAQVVAPALRAHAASNLYAPVPK